MGIQWWKSSFFFLTMAVLGVMLFPSQREMGKLFSESYVFDKARFHLEKLFHENPGDLANAERYLNSLRYLKEDALFLRAGRRMTHLYPDSVALNRIMAAFYEDRMDYEKSSYYWLRMLKAKPSLTETKEKLISYYTLYKQDDKLIAFYEMEIKNKTAGLETMRSLGSLYLLQKRAEKAGVLYAQILAEYPYDENDRVRLAGIYEYEGETQKAIAIYRQISQSNPENANYALKLVDVLIRYKKDKEALEVLESCATRFSGDGRFLEILSDMYAKLGRTKEAVLLLEKLYAENPQNYKLLKSLGELYLNAKDYEKAREALVVYNEKTGGDYHSHHVLGDVLLAGGDRPGSEREYRQALQLIREK